MVFSGFFLGVERRQRVKNQRYKCLNTPKMCHKKTLDFGSYCEKKIYTVRQKFAEISLKTFGVFFFPSRYGKMALVSPTPHVATTVDVPLPTSDYIVYG